MVNLFNWRAESLIRRTGSPRNRRSGCAPWQCARGEGTEGLMNGLGDHL